MMFAVAELRNRSVWHLYRMRDRIQIDPEYQRLGNIWSPENRRLLIDTLLNGFDVPKLYLHKFTSPLKKGGRIFDYAIVDGRQRLETLWAFIDGEISLEDDFKYFADPNVVAGGMTYIELGQKYPDLKADFDGFLLSVITIETDELEMIEEMFSRLNEAAPLTAAEKRNAVGGPIPVAVKKLAKSPFFVSKIPFPNKRYRHFDLAAKILLGASEGKIVDTKKSRLDDFAEHFKAQSRTKMPAFLKAAMSTANRMAGVFANKDPLLRQVGMTMVYYHLFRVAERDGWASRITRKQLLDFNKTRDENRDRVERGLKRVDLDLIEFDQYAQSPNDATALKFRVQLLAARAFDKKIKLDAL